MEFQELQNHLLQQINERWENFSENEASPRKLHAELLNNPIQVPNIPAELAPQKGYKAEVLQSWCEPAPFCVSLILIGPGQATATHDHICDCGLICLQGRIEHHKFQESSEKNLEIRSTDFLVPGSGCYFQCTEPNIHKLANPAQDKIACSLHIYSYDCRNHKSSVKNCYDDKDVMTTKHILSDCTPCES